jgi:class 3 adenylate cyclase
MLLVDSGRVDEGWSLMEEVSAAAAGGELGGYTTGAVFCNTVAMCRDLADYRRGSEWSDAARRWCERQAINGFPGVCRVHRGEIMRLLGAWPEAAAEVRRARDELSDFSPAHAAAANHELGEVLLRMGDLGGAEDAFRQAHELGEDPQPGLALLQLARGKVDAAAASIRRSVDEAAFDRFARARMLPVQAEIARAAGDAETARAAAEELARIAGQVRSPAIRAAAEWSAGHEALLAGDGSGAARRLRQARRLWNEVGAPYEAAKAGAVLAEAHLAEGDPEAARIEAEAAHAAFERLGAGPDRDRSAALLDRIRSSTSGTPARAQRTFLFTDVVGSTALLEAIGDEAWSDLRRWHDDALRACFLEHGGAEIDHAGDGFFVAFPDAPSALVCAVEIQRMLAKHRQTHGFAPQVRIGMHATEASQEGQGYTGLGVHTAARIAALAGRGEIVASASTVDGLPAVRASEAHEIRLSGIADPVSIVRIEWL